MLPERRSVCNHPSQRSADLHHHPRTNLLWLPLPVSMPRWASFHSSGILWLWEQVPGEICSRGRSSIKAEGPKRLLHFSYISSPTPPIPSKNFFFLKKNKAFYPENLAAILGCHSPIFWESSRRRTGVLDPPAKEECDLHGYGHWSCQVEQVGESTVPCCGWRIPEDPQI